MRSGIHGRDRVPVVEDDDLPFGAVGNGGRSAVYAKALPSVVREPPQRTDKPHKGTAPKGQARLAPLWANALCRMYDNFALLPTYKEVLHNKLTQHLLSKCRLPNVYKQIPVEDENYGYCSTSIKLSIQTSKLTR